MGVAVEVAAEEDPEEAAAPAVAQAEAAGRVAAAC